MKKWGIIFIGLIFFIFIASCSPDGRLSLFATPTFTLTITATFTVTPTNSSTPTETATPTITSTPKPLRTPTATATATHEPVDIAYIGTALPDKAQLISPDNIHKLMQVGQWGYGMINGVVFTPDGKQFIVSSAYGFAIYDINNLKNPPKWIPFSVPCSHDYVLFNEEGNLLRFVTNDDYQPIPDLILSFPNGEIAKETKDAVWLDPIFRSNMSYKVQAISNDGSKIFAPQTQHAIDRFEDETTSLLQILDADTNDVLLTLQDEILVRSFEERTSPQGCDVFWTGACATSNTADSYFPFHAAFSPDDSTLTVMYYIWFEYSAIYFDQGFVRIYDTSDGRLLQSFGDPDTYIPAFAYSPDSKYLLVAHDNGSIELWNTHAQETTFTAWHFNGEAEALEYAGDGQYVLIQRPDVLEIRSANNGALRARLEATLYDVSPANDNLIAYADKDYNIKLYDVAKSDNILSIAAHEDVIFDVRISPNGSYIASSSQDCTIKLWDAKTGEFLHYFEETQVDSFEHYPYPDTSPENLTRIFIQNLEFSPANDALFGFNDWRIVVKWNLDSGATQFENYFTGVYSDGFRVEPSINEIYFADKILDYETGERISEGNPNFPENIRRYFNDSNNYLEIDEFPASDFIYYYDEMDDPLGKMIRILPDNAEGIFLENLYISPDETTVLIQTNVGNYLVYQIVE